MPLFNTKFTPKKAPVRKTDISEVSRDGASSDELDQLDEKEYMENDTIKFRLGECETIFENGEWVPVTDSCDSLYRMNQKLNQQIITLKEENNLLKLKFDILLDMLAHSTAENHVHLRELDKLRKIISIK